MSISSPSIPGIATKDAMGTSIDTVVGAFNLEFRLLDLADEVDAVEEEEVLLLLILVVVGIILEVEMTAVVDVVDDDLVIDDACFVND